MYNEDLPSGAFRDFDYESYNEIQLPSDAFRVLIIFLIDSLQKHNEELPSGAFRDFDYENHNEVQLPSDAFRDFDHIFD